MKIYQIIATDEVDYRDAYKLTIINNKGESKTIEFYDCEPEDNSIARYFNDVYKIPELLKIAYDAGVAGESINITNEKVLWEEL